jgi:tRNA-guanine family transglycosylase
MLGGTLASVHNLYFTINLVKDMRKAMVEGSFNKFKTDFLSIYLKKD